jgi:hypothetical protein
LIPVRVPADLRPHIVSLKHLAAEHPLGQSMCPVCDGPLHDRTVALVAVGIAPEDRKPAGWTTGGCVLVHTECAGAEAVNVE